MERGGLRIGACGRCGVVWCGVGPPPVLYCGVHCALCCAPPSWCGAGSMTNKGAGAL